MSTVSDYTSLDYEAIREDLLRFMLSRTGQNLTNLNPSDPAVVLLDMLAYLGDLLSYTENQHVKEGIPVRAVRFENFREAVRGFGFEIRERSGSVAPIEATLDPSVLALGDIILLRTHYIATPAGLIFHPTEDYTFASAGPTTVEFDVEQGERISGEVLAAASPGTERQRYVLGYGPVIPDSLVIQVNGVEWSRTRAVALEEPTSLTYELVFDDNDVCTVKFGDGIHGLIPPTGQTIEATYRVGGGLSTNVEENTINQPTNVPAGILTVTNPERAEGGQDRETLVVAKARLPLTVRANDRGVSAPDYAALALEVSGIVKAYAESAVCGVGGCGKAITLYVIPEGGGPGSGLTPTHRSQILAKCREKGMTGKKVLVRDPSYASLQVTVDVYVMATAFTSRVQTLVSNTVADEYDFLNLDFGITLTLQNLYDILGADRITGVQRVLVRQFSVLPYMGAYPANPPTGNGGLLYPTISATSVRREWKFVCTNAGGSSGRAEFSVQERHVLLATEVSDTAVQDELQRFTPNEFPGTWLLRYNPYSPSETGTRSIQGNTSSSVSVVGSSLQDYIEPGDEAVIEKVALLTAYSYQNEWTVPGGGYTLGTTLYAPGADWAVGMKVRVRSSAGVVVNTTIVGGTAGNWTVADTLPAFTAGQTLTVDAVTEVTGATFVIEQGSRRFVLGDTFYVDTYPYLDDLLLRGRVYPELSEENLTLRMVGGRS